MMKNMIFNVLEIIIGLASGIVIGAGFFAILTFLGVIQRLITLTKTNDTVNLFGFAVILGVLLGTYLSFSLVIWKVHIVFMMSWGLLHGIFNGVMAAALAEVLNVFPLLSKRVGMKRYLSILLIAIVLGKISGSLFQWLYLVK